MYGKGLSFTHYTYDTAGQLTNAHYDGKGNIAYGYDSRYNRQSAITGIYPTITITAPANGANLTCNSYTITGTATATGSIAEIVLSFDQGWTWTSGGVSMNTSGDVTNPRIIYIKIVQKRA